MPTLLPVHPFLFEHIVALRLTLLFFDAYATGRISPSGCFCSSTAPKPYEDASAESVVSRFALYRASTGADVRLSFSCTKHICCACPNVQSFFLLRRSRIGFVISARCGVNFPNWLIIPRNRRIPRTSVGSGCRKLL